MSKPVILLVPGAWHQPSGFSKLTSNLTQHGYTVEAIPLASVGASPPLPDFSADVKGIASTITKYADQGSDIVILFHSYGGIPGSSACKGLLKSDREAAGKKGGVAHLIYCASFALDEGVCLMDGLGGEPLPWFVLDEDKETLMPGTPIPTFYNDIDDKALLDELMSSLQPQSYGAFWSKNSYAAFRDVQSTYVLCEKDEAIPLEQQEGMVANVKKVIAETDGKGSMAEVRMDTSHSPFLSKPDELARIIRGVAGEKV